MMKTLLFLTLSFLSIANLNAQEIYIPGEIARGETAAYYCKSRGKFFIEVRDVSNVDTTNTVYYLDGTIDPQGGEDLSGTYGHTQEDLQNIFREALTDEEWNKIKGKNGYGLTLYITADSTGNIKELSILFRKDDPTLSKFPPDRLYQLEMKFKEIIKLIYNPNAIRFRNAKFMQGISYRDLK